MLSGNSIRGPPQGQSVDIQGRPIAIASINALGIPSTFEDKTNSRALFMKVGTSDIWPGR